MIAALLLLLAGCAAAPLAPVPSPVSPVSAGPSPAGAMICTTGTGGALYLPFVEYTYDGETVTVRATDGEEYTFSVDRCYFMDEAR